MASDYDKGTITDRERTASQNQTKISQQSIRDVQNQLSRQLANYDFANRQNRRLADAQRAQNSLKTSEDRFEAQRDLQNSALGLLGSMGSAMNGSATGNLMEILRSRNDKENNTYWSQLEQNQNQVENSYMDSYNQNQVAKRDAMQAAEKAIRDITNDWRANMNNINPNLFPSGKGPVGGDSSLAASSAWRPSDVALGKPKTFDYIVPDSEYGPRGAASNRARTRSGSSDYFSTLMNRFNGR